MSLSSPHPHPPPLFLCPSQFLGSVNITEESVLGIVYMCVKIILFLVVCYLLFKKLKFADGIIYYRIYTICEDLCYVHREMGPELER